MRCGRCGQIRCRPCATSISADRCALNRYRGAMGLTYGTGARLPVYLQMRWFRRIPPTFDERLSVVGGSAARRPIRPNGLNG